VSSLLKHIGKDVEPMAVKEPSRLYFKRRTLMDKHDEAVEKAKHTEPSITKEEIRNEK
jgi:hypothetical protein